MNTDVKFRWILDSWEVLGLQTFARKQNVMSSESLHWPWIQGYIHAWPLEWTSKLKVDAVAACICYTETQKPKA